MRARELLTAVALKLVLDRVDGPAEVASARRHRSPGPRRSDDAHADAAAPTTPASVRRGPLFGLMMASAGVAVPLMIIFDHPVTRIVGVLGLFTFIVSGVFVIADPAFLDDVEER